MTTPPLPAAFLSSTARNRIKSFVHRWYALWDIGHPEPTELLSMLGDGFVLSFAGHEIASEANFRAAYDAVGEELIARSHHVHGVRVSESGDGSFRAEIELHYQRVSRADGACLSVFSHVNMGLVDLPEAGLQVVHYQTRRQPARPEP